MVRRMETSAPEDWAMIGWRNGHCLEDFRAVPELTDVEENGTIRMILSNIQAYYTLAPTVAQFAEAANILRAASNDRRPVHITADFATHEVFAVRVLPAP